MKLLPILDINNTKNKTLISLHEEQTVIHLDFNQSSCADILHHNPSSPSGYYRVSSDSTGGRDVY